MSSILARAVHLAHPAFTNLGGHLVDAEPSTWTRGHGEDSSYRSRVGGAMEGSGVICAVQAQSGDVFCRSCPKAGSLGLSRRHLLFEGDDLGIGGLRPVELLVRQPTQLLGREMHMLMEVLVLRGRNLNLPADGVRPNSGFANVVALVADARLKTHTVSLEWDLVRFDLRELFFTAGYSWNKSDSNTTGPFVLPANGDDLETEWGQTTARHTANAYFGMQPVDTWAWTCVALPGRTPL